MANPDIYFVHLRRPKNSGDQRADPFYEFGSFGCTGCHSRNLLHPKNARKLKGARLAFVQGGRLGSHLVLLTPPIVVVKSWLKCDKGKWGRICEVKWNPADMPLKYENAPVLVSNDDTSNFPSVMKSVRRTHYRSLVSGLSSLLRSRTGKLDDAMADEVVRVYEKWRRKAVARSGIASKYYETMCPVPQNPDAKRKATYRSKIRELVADIEGGDGVPERELPDATAIGSRCGAFCCRGALRRGPRCG